MSTNNKNGKNKKPTKDIKAQNKDIKNSNTPAKDGSAKKTGNDWYGFGVQLIKNLIYTLIFGLMGANFIFYYKTLDFDLDETDKGGDDKQDKYFPIKTSFYNKDFIREDVGSSEVSVNSDEGDANLTQDDGADSTAMDTVAESSDSPIKESKSEDVMKPDDKSVPDEQKVVRLNESIKEIDASRDSESSKKSDSAGADEKVIPTTTQSGGVEESLVEPQTVPSTKEQEPAKIAEQKEQVIEQKEQVIEQKEQSPEQKEQSPEQKEQSPEQKEQSPEQKEQSPEQKEQSPEQKEQVIEQKEQVIEQKEQSPEQKEQSPEQAPAIITAGKSEEKNGKKEGYKCNKKGKNKDKSSEEVKPDFPYNLFVKQTCAEEACDTPFLTWWKNIFSYSIFKTNQANRSYTRSFFKNRDDYSILTTDTSFYLLFVFYFIGGLIYSCLSGLIYLANALMIDSRDVKNTLGITNLLPSWVDDLLYEGSVNNGQKNSVFGDWSPVWWIIFNVFCFGIIFIIMTVFTIITIIQYIINFTIKPLMNDQADIKEILKCNVHTLILFFCLLTVSSSSEYLDDISTIVMAVVTGLYFIRTAIIYVQG
jgi:hypothetical protein